MFYTGQRVVCVDASLQAQSRWSPAADVPTEGDIYTVLWCGSTTVYGREGVGVRLREIANGPHAHGLYRASRFRPLCEPKTSIEIFRKALTDDLIGEEA